MEIAYWHAWNLVTPIGPRRFSKLLEYFGSAEAAWKADEGSLASLLGGQNNLSQKVLALKAKIDVSLEFEKLSKKKIAVTSSLSADYPQLLRNIYDPPPILYYRGNIQVAGQKAIAIVGSRNATGYGRQMTEKLARELVKCGFGIVSGMARGIDSYAHQGALEAQGDTVAVLGCGLDIVYPRENKLLMDSIMEKGVVISEFPPGRKPEPFNFPRRNRIISGLALGVVVVEAAEKSGSLITADYALEQGKDVFAVPGPALSRLSKGTNNLIKQGAKLIESAADIVEEYGYTFDAQLTRQQPDLTVLESKIIKMLSWEPTALEKISAQLEVMPEELLSNLAILEIKGLVKQLPGQKYIVKS